jgi:hypothetical protein
MRGGILFSKTKDPFDRLTRYPIQLARDPSPWC